MAGPPLILKDFFTANRNRPIAESCNASVTRKAVDLAAGSLPPMTRKTLFKSVAGALDEFFQIGLDDILESAWDRVAAVRDIKAASRDDPSRILAFPMFDHKLSLNQRPHIDLVVAGKALNQLPFEVALGLKLSGVHLAVGSGRIHGLTAGLCTGEASFSLGGVNLLERNTPQLSLPGRLAFKGAAGD